MAHMQFDAALDELVRLDGPIQKGPVPRWQRKAKENADFRGISSPTSTVRRRPSSTRTPVHTTPRRRAMLKSLGKTPKSERKPKQTPGKSKKNIQSSPKKSEQNGMQAAGDRFIPNRALMDLDRSNYLLTSTPATNAGDFDEPTAESEAQDKYKTAVMERLNGIQPTESKILSFKQKAPKAQEGHYNNLKVLYSSSKSTTTKGHQCSRFIPSVADRILDAPLLRDDFYLTLLDWGPTNQVAVALDNEVYLWNASNGTIDHLLEAEGGEEYVTCVAWIQQGCVLAVSISDGTIQLWDVEQKKCLRHMAGHASRVGTLAWNQYILSSGSRSGKIHHHDVRIPEHHIATLDNHTQEVCGLRWSSDGKYLASGGNDNLLNIWENTNTEPLHNITQHQAAIKALAWCPWQPNVLASGGGTADRTIHFWNASTGHSLHNVDTGSQISSILWSQEHKELISAHGYSQYQLTVWKYPTMAKVCNLRGHTNRVLSMCLSPDKTTIMSCAGDETLRLWKCFMPVNKKKSAVSKKAVGSISSSLSSMQIR